MFRFKKCDGCNRDLALGTSKYNVRIEVTSDFDGFIPMDGGDDSNRIEDLIASIEDMAEEELEADVHVEYELTLCRECRNRFVEEMENHFDGGLSPKSKQPIKYH